MLRAVIISPSQGLADELQSALAGLPVAIVRVVEHYPTENELVRLLRSLTPQLILLSVESLQEITIDVGEGLDKALGVSRREPGVPLRGYRNIA